MRWRRCFIFPRVSVIIAVRDGSVHVVHRALPLLGLLEGTVNWVAIHKDCFGPKKWPQYQPKNWPETTFEKDIRANHQNRPEN